MNDVAKRNKQHGIPHPMKRDFPRAKLKKAFSKKKIPFWIISAIVLYAFIYSVVNVGGPSFYGDDTVYLSLAYSVLAGTFHESSYIFTVRLLQIFPISFFYALFGINMLSSSLYDIISFVLTVFIVFLIGRELYNNVAGITAALLLSFFPLVVRLSATISDDIPMMFITSLVMLSIIMAEKYNSKKWYFVSGLSAIASPIVTPEGFIIIPIVVVFILIELFRRKMRISRVSMFFIYGLLAAGIALMLANFVLSGNPLITLTVNGHFYSAVGKPNTIPSTNTNLAFYIGTMFPYNILSTFTSNMLHNNIASAFSFLFPSFFVPDSRVGFYMYFVVIAFVYLLVKRDRHAYVPMLWFLLGFSYLEFGPMHISLHPFEYLLSYRLGRFLTLIAPPAVLILGIAVASAVERGHKIRRSIGIVLSVAAVVFLIATSIPINANWHETLVCQRNDQIAIANYLSGLPSSTKIYFSGFASLVPIYMHFDNLSRFYAYDQIANCSAIPANAYVIIPYFRLFNLNYTPNPQTYCPNWQLVFAPQLPAGCTALQVQDSVPFEAKLYHVPAATTPTQISPANTSNSTRPLNTSKFNFFNLTGVGTYNKSLDRLTSFVRVNNVRAVEVLLNKTEARPGEYVNLSVLFIGNFLWGNASEANAVTAYLSSPIINIHYYGVELANETSMLLVQSNGPWYKYVTQIGEPHQLLYKSPSRYLLVHWIITPNQTMQGKTLKLCGGYFAAYQNTTLMSGWGYFYNTLAYEQRQVINDSVINIPSKNCAYLNVT